MPMLVPTNSSGMNQPRTIVIMSNHVQQQLQSQTTPEMSVRPSLMMGNSGFAMQNGTPVMTTNQSSGPTLLRTSSGLIEVKNLRMPMGQRVMITPQGSTIPVQRFPSSDPTTAPRTFNGVTLASGIKRPFPQSGIRIVNTSVSNLIALPQSGADPNAPTTPTSPVTPEISPKVVQISPALLKTLQTINQTKMVSGEREKLLSVGPKRVQLQK